MTIHTHYDSNSGVATIEIIGDLNLVSLKDFRQSYENIKQEVTEFVVELENAHYIDSSGLGMLLVLNDFAENLDSKVSICNANDTIRNILELSNFDQIFELK